MLTEPQFYLRVLEELLKYNSLENDQHLLYDSDDLAEYMEKKFGVVNDDDDSNEAFEKQHAAIEQIELTLKGFVQAMGKKVGIDLKFMENN
jgi:tetrahydromethanopterin S-methyltransferase subunit G